MGLTPYFVEQGLIFGARHWSTAVITGYRHPIFHPFDRNNSRNPPLTASPVIFGLTTAGGTGAPGRIDVFPGGVQRRSTCGGLGSR